MDRRALVLGRLVSREREEDEGRSFGPIGAIGAEKKIRTDWHSGGVRVTVARTAGRSTPRGTWRLGKFFYGFENFFNGTDTVTEHC